MNLKTLNELQFLLAWLKTTLKCWNGLTPEAILKDITFLAARFNYTKSRYEKDNSL